MERLFTWNRKSGVIDRYAAGANKLCKPFRKTFFKFCAGKGQSFLMLAKGGLYPEAIMDIALMGTEYPVLAWSGKEHCATILADHCIARTRRLLHFTIAQRFFLR